MRKNLDKSVIDTVSDVTYATVEEASGATGLSVRQIELRATKENGWRWCDPSTRRSFLGRRSRRKGNNWELEVIRALKDIGYDGCVSSRSESKRADDSKVDIIDTADELPCRIQAKNTKALPNWHRIESQCRMKDKPFVILCKRVGCSPPLAILPADFFYALIKK